MTSTLRPHSTRVTFKLHSQGAGVAQTIQPEGSAHAIQVDAAPAFGGQDQHPSPIAYALSALISCSQVTAQLVAKDLGVTLRQFEFDIQADLDTDILVNGAVEGNPNFQDIEIKAIVATDISASYLRNCDWKRNGAVPSTSYSREAASILSTIGHAAARPFMRIG